MTKYVIAIAMLTLMLASPGAVRAQDTDEIVPLKVQVVIARWEGDKKISSMPYTLSVNASADPAKPGRANLRMGSRIPVAVMTAPKVPGPEGKEIQAGPSSYQYQDVGTNIDCFAKSYAGGRYQIEITIDDTSVYDDHGKTSDRPSFRSFRASDSMILKDGQTAQFTAASDKVSGEVTKVDVTLNVVR